MSNPSFSPPMQGLRFLPVLMGISLLCLLAAVSLLFIDGRARPADVSADDPTWQTLRENAATIQQGKETAIGVSAAAARVHELMPRLLAELGNLSSSLGGPQVQALERPLERFEWHGQRIQQDLDALAAGASDPSATAQRIADSTDYLNQVLRGLAGEDNEVGISTAAGRITSAEGATRLQTVRALFNEINDHARNAVSAAQTLIPVQTASRAMADAAKKLAVQEPNEDSADSGWQWSLGFLGLA